VRQFVTPRRIVIGYAVAGLLAGTAFAASLLRDKLNGYYRHETGRVDSSPTRTVTRKDPVTRAYYETTVQDGRPLNLVEKGLIGFQESLGLPLVAGVVGLCWGYVHLKMREWIADPFGDLNKLDYEELADRPCPHGMT
jgi:hypothetical protein